MARSERFVKPPHAAYVSRKNMPITMMDRQLAAMRLQQEEASMRLTTEQELAAELMDFTHVMETDEYGFPLSTRYQVPDDVPDVYIPPQKSPEKVDETMKYIPPQKSPEKVDETKKEITPDSGTPPLPE